MKKQFTAAAKLHEAGDDMVPAAAEKNAAGLRAEKKFYSAELWHIHRQRKTFYMRKDIFLN